MKCWVEVVVVVVVVVDRGLLDVLIPNCECLKKEKGCLQIFD